MRPSDDGPVGHRPTSATPIYDALYSEYRRLFRALPGDRSGEEGMEFKPFGNDSGGGRSRERGSGSWDRIGTWDHGGAWDAAGRQRRGNTPPALPPGQRDNRRHGL